MRSLPLLASLPFRLLLLAALLATAPGLAVEPPLAPGAFALIGQRVDESRTGFFVYKDADSGFNHGFPSGLFGALDRISVNGACVEDPASPSACSTDLARLDRVRGTVIRIAFSPLAAGQFAGINFEEPENWGSQPRGVGYDLTGATALVLRARSPNGARVQFGIGGSTTPFVTLPAGWTELSFPLSGLSPPVALGNVHLLFAVATNVLNAPAGGTLFLDDVRLEPVPAHQATVPSLPLGNQTFGVVARTDAAPGRVPFPLDQVLRNTATLYETAIAIQALVFRGLPNDLVRARQLAEALRYALDHDNRGDLLPLAPDGSRGLHNGYETGDLPLRNDQGPGAGQAGEVRLAGFSAGTSTCGPSGFCLNLDGATGGNNAFAMLALLDLYQASPNPLDLDAARMLARWIAANLTDTSVTSFGGYFLGYPDEGVPPPKPLNRGKSVENNADIFAAFSRLARTERRLGNLASAQLWEQRARVAGDFVLRMFDPATGCFFAGTVLVTQGPAPGIDPSGERRGDDVVNVYRFVDANTFIALALARSHRYRTAIDWRRPAQCVLDRFQSSVSAAGASFSGFDLDEIPDGPAGVAWEFTGQASELFRWIDFLTGQAGFSPQAAIYLDELRHARTAAPFGDGNGLPASTLAGGDLLPPLEQCLSTPFQCIPERVGLAATIWALLAELGANPLGVPERTPADFNGNGSSDVVLYRNGTWVSSPVP